MLVVSGYSPVPPLGPELYKSSCQIIMVISEYCSCIFHFLSSEQLKVLLFRQSSSAFVYLSFVDSLYNLASTMPNTKNNNSKETEAEDGRADNGKDRPRDDQGRFVSEDEADQQDQGSSKGGSSNQGSGSSKQESGSSKQGGSKSSSNQGKSKGDQGEDDENEQSGSKSGKSSGSGAVDHSKPAGDNLEEARQKMSDASR